jgi:hypothetical protein
MVSTYNTEILISLIHIHLQQRLATNICFSVRRNAVHICAFFGLQSRFVVKLLYIGFQTNIRQSVEWIGSAKQKA